MTMTMTMTMTMALMMMARASKVSMMSKTSMTQISTTQVRRLPGYFSSLEGTPTSAGPDAPDFPTTTRTPTPDPGR
jgi:hypothetical protein